MITHVIDVEVQLGQGIMQDMDDWCVTMLPEPCAHTWSLDVVQDQVSMHTHGWRFRFHFQDEGLAVQFVLAWSHVIVATQHV